METLPVFRRRADDERIVAEREWKAGLKPTKPQEPCDHGLFGDEARQLAVRGTIARVMGTRGALIVSGGAVSKINEFLSQFAMEPNFIIAGLAFLHKIIRATSRRRAGEEAKIDFKVHPTCFDMPAAMRWRIRA